ncbi:DUF1573 domain-containing protein [Planctomicrobium sp. SH664]|uniref:DUF1573 domain-containing protein n=1 Tax=Planctomicrobium sp. SH664 TaxID=3448125 RepID=UPI003F5BED3A
MKLWQVFVAVATLILSVFVISVISKMDLIQQQLKPTVKQVTLSSASSKYEGVKELEGDTEAVEDPEAEKDKAPGHTSNPFKLDATAKSLPKVETDHPVVEFGRMALGKTGNHEFKIRNTGTAPLKLAKGPVQCKCTLSGLREEEIPPGGEGVVHLEWTPKEEGEFSQSATIWTNDPANPEIKFITAGKMFKEVTITPEHGWKLGTIYAERPAELHGAIVSGVIPSFEITKVETSSDRVKIAAFPIPPNPTETPEILCGYEISGTVEAGEEPALSESVTFHTTLADYPTITLPITATKAGPLMIVYKDWYSVERLLDLKTVKARDGKTFSVTLVVDAGSEPLKFTSVKTVPGFLKVSLEPKTVTPGAAKEFYTMKIEVPKESPHGAWLRPQPGTLLIETNRADLKSIELKVALIVD